MIFQRYSVEVEPQAGVQQRGHFTIFQAYGNQPKRFVFDGSLDQDLNLLLTPRGLEPLFAHEHDRGFAFLQSHFELRRSQPFDGSCRVKQTTLWSASPQSIQRKPSAAKSERCSAGSSR